MSEGEELLRRLNNTETVDKSQGDGCQVEVRAEGGGVGVESACYYRERDRKYPHWQQRVHGFFKGSFTRRSLSVTVRVRVWGSVLCVELDGFRCKVLLERPCSSVPNTPLEITRFCTLPHVWTKDDRQR